MESYTSAQQQTLGRLLEVKPDDMNMNMKNCKCGCGKKVNKTWAIGHHRKGATFSMPKSAREKIRLAQLGEGNSMHGRTPWNKGKTGVYSDEQIKRIKEARANQVVTDIHRNNISKSLKKAYESGVRSGKNSVFYIDGRSRKNSFKNSFEYRNWRKKVFERDDYECQNCNVRGGELHADHILPKSVFPELIYELDNGRTLCVDCHRKTKTWGQKHYRTGNTTSLLLAVGGQT